MKIRPVTFLSGCCDPAPRTLLLALVFATGLPLLCSCRPAAPSRGDPVVSDAAFFGSQMPLLGLVNDARALLDKELKKSAALPANTSGAVVDKADLSLTADFHLPTGLAPRYAEIAAKHGPPDRSEPAPAKEAGMTVHYYGDIGLGVVGPAETGAVTRIFVRRTLPLKH